MGATKDWIKYFIADFNAGTLTWRVRPREHFPSERGWKIFNTSYAGKSAGCVKHSGYLEVKLLGKDYLVHRIIYEMAKGPIAEGLQIDHWDRNKSNNSLSNLREVTNRENCINTGLQSNNTSGVRGVYWCKARGMWAAQIVCHGRTINLGRFTDFDEAVSTRKAAELKYFGEFAENTRGNKHQ